MRYFIVQNEISYGRGRYLMTEIEREGFNTLRRKPPSSSLEEQWWFEVRWATTVSNQRKKKRS